ncbi:hypothetical protein [Mucilaginibacter sp.]|uniref:hypothetical protein n=1 Tax=Mucilaginibacter sp. TaxID=1882438 RepID=UPI0025CE1CA7|nr:hypothetical protein [Mucilaginibacter sp.]
MSEDEENRIPPEQPPIKPTVSFAPADPTDGRKAGSWRTRYDTEALPYIWREARYVGFLILIIPVLLIVIHQDFFNQISIPHVIKKYSYAWIGGCLGGTLFSTKWLYHSVARNVWNQDRFLWRVFTPHISGALAFSFILLMSSGIINLFSPVAMEKSSAVFGVSFLIGYFSDSAVAKLTEIANTLFGATQKEPGKKPENPPIEKV